ncbi:polysaccharide biosynthesis/export family protein [Rhodovulum sp. DZ06]|uniref:polysaccharide biosynthesis/export family protein n=1 Tax=Rhodovulum sp. DZ06 TaxID=3425126 RepID=UPI003D341FF3
MAVACAAAFGLSGCGVIYTVPDVSEAAGDVDVRVVAMTFETAAEANLSAYTPARLPPYFRPEPAPQSPRLGVPNVRTPQMPDLAAQARRDGQARNVSVNLPEGAAQRTRGPGVAATRMPPPSEPRPYRIGVADVVLLAANTAGAELNDVPALIAAQSRRQGYIVQDDGAIAVPDVGRVRIAGKTLEEAEAEIFNALVAQRLDPTFSLEIAEFNSQRVSVGGDVRSPTLAPITLKPTTLTEALSLAGGVTGTDTDYAVVRLFRNGEVYQAPLSRLYGENGLQDVLLRDGDSVYVDTSYDEEQARRYFEEQLRLRQAELAEREFAFRQLQADIDEVRLQQTLAQFEIQKAQLTQAIARMRIDVASYNNAVANQAGLEDARQREAFQARLELGAVKRDYAYLAGELRINAPSRIALPFENRLMLADALFHTLSPNAQFADYGEIYVLRKGTAGGDFGAVTAYHLDADNAAALTLATDFEMRPNDVVFISAQPVTSWNRVISQLTPQIFLQAATTANGL